MKRIIYLGLFISILAAIIAAGLSFVPGSHHILWFKKAIEILLLVFSTWILLRLLNRFIWPGIRENFAISVSHLFVVALNIIIFAIMIFAITIGTLGLDPKSIITASGLITAGLAIALQGIIADVAASIIIDLDRLYRIGDWIKIDEELEGKVIDIGWRHTAIVTLNKTTAIVNNGKMLSSAFHNFGTPPNWVIDEFSISLSHSIPAHRVKRVVETALKRHEIASKSYAQVLARTVDAGGVNYFVRYGHENQEIRWETRHSIIDYIRQELHGYGLRISEGLGEYGIFRGNQPLVPKEYSEHQDQLLKCELFHGFSETQIKKLLEVSTPTLIQENTTVIHKGDTEKSLYIIGEGSVEILLTQGESRLLYSSDYFGEQGFLLGNPRNADVIAKTNLLLYKYSKTDLEPILKLHPDTLNQMLAVMMSRSSDLEEAIRKSKKIHKNESLQDIIIKTVKEFFSA